jgi:outer membrane protein W
MKHLVTSLVLLSSLSGLEYKKNYGSEFETADSYSNLTPFVSVGYNIVAVDDMSEDNTFSLDLSVGWVYDQNSKFMLSTFRDTKDLSAQDTLKFEHISLSYDHSLNTFGQNKGFYVGGGIAKNNFTEKKFVDSNFTTSTYNQVDIFLKAGFEYKQDSNWIYDVSLNGTLIPINKSSDAKDSNLYFTRFSVKYLFTQY